MMQKFMRQKLSYSQNIVEGLALGNQEMVITNAAKLMYMTKSNAWMQVKVSGYLEQTRKFQDDVIVLGNEARARNNSGVLAAYARVTGGCIECHQAYRSTQATNRVSTLAVPQNSVWPGASGAIEKPKK